MTATTESETDRGGGGAVSPSPDVVVELHPSDHIAADSIAFSPDDKVISFLVAPESTLGRHIFGFDLALREQRLLATLPEDGIEGVEGDPSPIEKQHSGGTGEQGLGRKRYEWARGASGPALVAFLPRGIYIQDEQTSELRLRVPSTSYSPAVNPELSPDGRSIAYVRDGEIYVVPAGGDEIQMTSDARGTGKTNGIAQDKGQGSVDRRPGFWWSPDSREIAFLEIDVRGAPSTTVEGGENFVEDGANPADPSALKANVIVRLGIVSAERGDVKWAPLVIGGTDHNDEEYLARVVWLPDGTLVAEVRDLAQSKLKLLKLNLGTGERRTLLEEGCSGGNSANCFTPLQNGGFVWASERYSSRHLYLYDAEGECLGPLTEGNRAVEQVLGVDEKAGVIYFMGTSSLVETHLYSTLLSPNYLFPAENPKQLTRGIDQHVVRLDHQMENFVDVFADGMDTPPRVQVCSLQSPRLAELQVGHSGLNSPQENIDGLDSADSPPQEQVSLVENIDGLDSVDSPPQEQVSPVENMDGLDFVDSPPEEQVSLRENLAMADLSAEELGSGDAGLRSEVAASPEEELQMAAAIILKHGSAVGFCDHCIPLFHRLAGLALSEAPAEAAVNHFENVDNTVMHFESQDNGVNRFETLDAAEGNAEREDDTSSNEITADHLDAGKQRLWSEEQDSSSEIDEERPPPRPNHHVLNPEAPPFAAPTPKPADIIVPETAALDNGTLSANGGTLHFHSQKDKLNFAWANATLLSPSPSGNPEPPASATPEQRQQPNGKQAHQVESPILQSPGERLTKSQREAHRLRLVERKKDFICIERVHGKTVNIVAGLELHQKMFSKVEQQRLVDLVYEYQELGRQGLLKERTYSQPRKWMAGKGRVTIQFGCCYNYAVDKAGNPPGIINNVLVDPLPQLLKNTIRRLVRWGVIPPACVPDSCIVNIYDVGDCIPPHIDHHDFVRPFCTLSLLSECEILFGSKLSIVGEGKFDGPMTIPLPVGSVLVLKGNGADVAKHAVPGVPTKRISITFRKMDPTKVPMGYVLPNDLRGIKTVPHLR